MHDKYNHIWFEKYRPQTLDDLCIPKKTKDLLISWGTQIPHLLIALAPIRIKICGGLGNP